MHIETIRHKRGDRVYVSYLLRQTYREDGKIKHRTIANLTGVPLPIIELLRSSLRGEPVTVGRDKIRCIRSRSHGSVWAVTAVMKKLGLPALLGARPEPWHRIVLGMIAARVLASGSKLYATRWWKTTTLAEDWRLPVDEDGPVEKHQAVNPLYKALDALVARQAAIEKKLVERHLQQGALVLFDLSSSYVEGRKCPLAAFGHNRDGKKGKQQITYGLLTTREGCPVAIEVFAGNQSDPMSLKPQIERLRKEYGFTDLVVVGDRGMISKTRIADLEAVGLDWLTSLRSPDIQKLHQRGVLQLSLFDQRDLVELHDSEQNPGRRLVACRNPLLAEDRARKREELLADTERELAKIATRVQAGRLKQAAAIGVAVGKVINRRKVAKHFRLTIDEGVFTYERDAASIGREAALDGVYVVVTNVPEDKLPADEAVAGYKSLRNVEQAFRTMKTTLLELRPIFHRLEDRVRAHAFLCMLAYYVVWHLRQALAPLLTEAGGFTSLQALLTTLATIERHTMEVRGYQFRLVTEPDDFQRRILELLDVPIPA